MATTIVRVTHKGETIESTPELWQAAADEMVKRLGGPWGGASGSKIERVEREHLACANASVTAPRVNSDFGNVVHDAQAAARLEKTYDKLEAAGVTGIIRGGEKTAMGYVAGDRMADVGYATQAARRIEHDKQQGLDECVAQLEAAQELERRRDVVLSAADFGAKLSMNGTLRFERYAIREQAVRGLVLRLKSPCLTAFLGIKDRIANAVRELKAFQADAHKDAECWEGFNPERMAEHIANDKAELLYMLQRECARMGDVQLKVRARDGLGDVFALLSPSYANADATDVLRDAIRELPRDAKATFAYDPTSTAWELRANVFTPVPTDEQAVGEPFESFLSVRSRDNGTSSRFIGGGISLLQCLNASVYVADGFSSKRRHVGSILAETTAAVAHAAAAMHALCEAWGESRNVVIARPADDAGALIPMEVAIPGFFRSLLTARKGELVGVLPGRTEAHVKALAATFETERRDGARIVRADFAQAWTRYIQGQSTPVRRDAEAAIGKWIVSDEAVNYVVA